MTNQTGPTSPPIDPSIDHGRAGRRKEVVRALNEVIVTGADVERTREFIAERLDHGRRGLEHSAAFLLAPGPDEAEQPPPADAAEGFSRGVLRLHRVIEGWKADTVELVAEGATVVSRQTMSGRVAAGALPGVTRATEVRFDMVVFFRFDDDDRICGVWALGDEFGLWDQLGLPGGPAAAR